MLASLLRTIVRVRSHITWLSDGGANTRFFHLHARNRQKKNFIARLQKDDQVATSQEDMEEMVWEFCNSLMGMADDLQDLDAPISEDEVWNVIKTLPIDKAPAPTVTLDASTRCVGRSSKPMS